MEHSIPITIRWQDTPPDEMLETLLIEATRQTLRRFAIVRPRVELLLADDATLWQLNRTWRGIDRATDVLSFAAREGEPLRTAGHATYLGDIAISLETAARQADTLAHTLPREAVFLLIHGLLHLLGYDHLTDEDEREMIAEQRDIIHDLTRAGLFGENT